MKIVLSDWAWVSDTSAHDISELKKFFTVINPIWKENNKRRRHNGGVNKWIKCYHETDGGIGFPRGAMSYLKRTYNPYHILDHRQSSPVDIAFTGTMKLFQADMLEDAMKRDFGTIVAPTGAGKTVMGLKAISLRGRRALVLVHTKNLLEQWIERATFFLDIDPDEIGTFVSGQKKRFGDRLTIAMVQTMAKNLEMIPDGKIGHLLVDECHRIPTNTFASVTSTFNPKYTIGLSATPYRRDKLDNLIWWYAGPISAQANRDELVERGDILVPTVVVKHTNFSSRFDPTHEYSNLITDLAENQERNTQICMDVAAEVNTSPSGTCLVISDRKIHCHILQDGMRKLGKRSLCLTGETKTAERDYITAELNAGKVEVLIATGQLIGEGFDCKNLCSLFIASPVKFSGRLIQYAGRILRPMDGKEAKIYDYADIGIGPLLKSYEQRLAQYRAWGAKII